MVHAVFVPIFFASIGVKIDFLANFDFFLVGTFLVVAIGGKFIGAWVGGIAAKLPKADSLSLGIAHIPGGAMEIIIGMLALELKLIPESVFVPIVFAAVLSSIIVGPLLSWSIGRRRPLDIGSFLKKEAIIGNLSGKTRWDVIPELCQQISTSIDKLKTQAIVSAVQRREEIMGT